MTSASKIIGVRRAKSEALSGAANHSPHLINQMRWAFRLHMWKHGVKWEHYAHEMRLVLGLKRGDAGINDKDPKSFLVHGVQPTGKKLALFQRFLQQVCPDFLSFNLGGDQLLQAAVDLQRVFIDLPLSETETQEIGRASSMIELFIFCELGGAAHQSLWFFSRMGGTPFMVVKNFRIAIAGNARNDPRPFLEQFKARNDMTVYDYSVGVLVPYDYDVNSVLDVSGNPSSEKSKLRVSYAASVADEFRNRAFIRVDLDWIFETPNDWTYEASRPDKEMMSMEMTHLPLSRGTLAGEPVRQSEKRYLAFRNSSLVERAFHLPCFDAMTLPKEQRRTGNGNADSFKRVFARGKV